MFFDLAAVSYFVCHTMLLSVGVCRLVMLFTVGLWCMLRHYLTSCYALVRVVPPSMLLGLVDSVFAIPRRVVAVVVRYATANPTVVTVVTCHRPPTSASSCMLHVTWARWLGVRYTVLLLLLCGTLPPTHLW